MNLTIEKVNKFIDSINISISVDTHVLAYNHLQREEFEQALQLWENYLKKNQDDLVTIHHLAIIYHQNAIKQEKDGNWKGTTEHFLVWQKALNYWARLCNSEEFWIYYIKKVKTIFPEICEEHSDILKEKVPRDILMINYRFLKDAAVKKDTERAAMHYQLVKQSGFSLNLVKEILNLILNEFLSERNENGLMIREMISQGHCKEVIDKAKFLIQMDEKNFWGMELLVQAYIKWNEVLLVEKKYSQIERNLKENQKVFNHFVELVGNKSHPPAMESNLIYEYINVEINYVVEDFNNSQGDREDIDRLDSRLTKISNLFPVNNPYKREIVERVQDNKRSLSQMRT